MVCGVPAGQETQEPWVEGGEGGVYYLLRSPGELLESSAGSQSIGRMTPALQNKGAMVYFGLRFSLNFWLQRVPLPRLSLWLSQPEIWRSARVIGGEQRPSAVGRMSRPVSPCLWHGSSQSSPCRCSAQRRAAGTPFCVCACARVRAPTCLSLCVSVARLVGASGEASGKPVVWGEGSRRGLAAGRKQDLSSRAACGCRSACSRVRRVPVRAQGDGRRPPRAPWRLRLLCSHRGRETPPLSRYSFAPGHWELGDPSPGFCGP